MRIRDFSKLNVAITGASSGIGAATARLLAELGAGLGLAARNRVAVEAVAKECKTLGAREVLARSVDVGKWEPLSDFANSFAKSVGDAHVLVANAGFGNLGNTLDLPPEGVESLIRTNVTGVIWSVQAFAEQLARTHGQAIVIGSVVSRVAVPYSSVYSGSKWALRGWTRGARPELESRGIALTLLNPGFVQTPFFENRVNAPGIKPWNPQRGMTAEAVGRKILRAIRRRPAEMNLTALGRIAPALYVLMPVQWPRIMGRFRGFK